MVHFNCWRVVVNGINYVCEVPVVTTLMRDEIEIT